MEAVDAPLHHCAPCSTPRAPHLLHPTGLALPPSPRLRTPQLANDPRAAATACSSRRSCVASFPTLERDGVLFAWMDNSPEGIKAKVGGVPHAHRPRGVLTIGPEGLQGGSRRAVMGARHGACMWDFERNRRDTSRGGIREKAELGLGYGLSLTWMDSSRRTRGQGVHAGTYLRAVELAKAWGKARSLQRV